MIHEALRDHFADDADGSFVADAVHQATLSFRGVTRLGLDCRDRSRTDRRPYGRCHYRLRRWPAQGSPLDVAKRADRTGLPIGRLRCRERSSLCAVDERLRTGGRSFHRHRNGHRTLRSASDAPRSTGSAPCENSSSDWPYGSLQHFDHPIRIPDSQKNRRAESEEAGLQVVRA